ncbi:MAG TPA: nucleotidyltransferase family protein [Anaerolineae bacterium]|nr:nucleotidyltransferase family protein [Anaerolineae bacterium]
MGKDFLHKNAKAWQPLATQEQVLFLNLVQGKLPQPLPTNLDWDTINRRLRSDGLAPFVYHQLGTARQQLPPATQQLLQQNYYQNLSVNHIRFEALRTLGQQLATANIPVLVLKGGALALTVYPDPSLRFMGDLDITVPPHQTEAALHICQQNGYNIHPDDLPDLQNRTWLHHEGWHIRLIKQVHGKQMVLELHWPLRPTVLISQVAQLDLTAAWQAAIPLEPNHNLYQFHPAWQLLHLCLHTGLQHRFTDLGLRQYIDIDLLLRDRLCQTPDFWPTFISLAQQARAQHVSYFCLRLTQALLGTPLPDDALAPLLPPATKTERFDQIFDPAFALNRHRAFYDHQRSVWRQLTTDRWQDRLAGPWQQLFPSADYLTYYYDIKTDWQHLFYKLWHPLHAVARASRRRVLSLASRHH